MNIKQILDELNHLADSSIHSLFVVGVTFQSCPYREYHGELCFEKGGRNGLYVRKFCEILSNKIGTVIGGYNNNFTELTEYSTVYIEESECTSSSITSIQQDGNTLSFVTSEETW